MEEIVEKLFKELQKSLEKISVQTIGRVNAQKAYTNQQKAQKEGKVAIESAKKTVSSTEQTLEGSLKGQFGKKITEVLKEQQQTLDKL
ncbi:hypothetical protein KVJ52_001407 [Enterococcus faecalis]|nr:hypothetical protein [Enterococcus faecalis]EHK2996034.1 hypothetical protein [Enterococcus faecalis]EHS2358013.1 hypothetical protein [Enterococcus faecalis]EKJ5011329.1 hypothetical protein [Enterococcus faecalis]NSQ20505.1 hypothetical protein [Enterococcus faecalis]